MSKKKIFYTLFIMVLDFVAFYTISVLAMLVIQRGNFDDLPWQFFIVDLAFVLVKLCFNFIVGNYKLLWMYSIRLNMLKLVSICIGLDMIFWFVTTIPQVAEFTGYKFSTYVVMMLLEFSFLVISRYFISVFLNHIYRNRNTTPTEKANTLIIGAGSAGAMMLNEIANEKSLPYKVVGFLDDSKDKIGQYISFLKIYGPIDTLNEVCEKLQVKKIIIALPSAGKDKIKELLNSIDYTKYSVEILPDKSKLLKDSLYQDVRKVEIADLLGRREIELNDERVANFYKDKIVLVTGGGGSIGSELCRQIAKMNPKKLVILDIYENCAYEIQQELRFKYKDALNMQVEIISITNRPALERVFEMHKPNIVVMAAAHKHVPLMEHNVIEAVENNVFGTLNTVELAEKYGCERVHMVSTDKAVNPTSIMGATKRICEMIVQAHSTIDQYTTFSITRFGNVLGSAGSVIPLFKKQIEAGGPITLTDHRIIRYFMTIPEASQLVLTSSSMAKNGELFVLDMGQPVKIYDLAKNMIRLSGLVPDEDIKIIETGLRPGEKLYEELLVKTEELDKTDNELIFIERDKPLSLDEIKDKLVKLEKGIKDGNDSKMKEIIKSVVPTFVEKEVANKNFDGKEVK